jgi:sRNA-binding carbon storage regulator CsrA
MLVLSRRTDESIVIEPADGANGSMTLAQLFADGAIVITLLGGTGRRVKVGIEAPEHLSIQRKDAATRQEKYGAGTS